MSQDSSSRIEILESEIGFWLTRYENHKEDAGDRIGWCLWLLIKYGAIHEAMEIYRQIVNLVDVPIPH